MHKYVLLLHLLAATVWTGGHLVLAFCLLPGFLRRQAVNELLAFEAAYERLGMAALAIQVLTGLWLAWRFAPDIGQWAIGGSFIAHLVQAKLALLVATVIVAVHTRRWVLPTLSVATSRGWRAASA